jgi:Flp pilus assembly protein protease CpaA
MAAITDLLKDKIYNWLTLSAFFVGLFLSAYSGKNFLLESLYGIGVGALIFLPLFFLKIMGGGDAKLIISLGSVLGVKPLIELISISVLLAALGAIGVLMKRRRFFHVLKENFLFLKSLVIKSPLGIHKPELDKNHKTPFGLAIFLAYLILWI